MVVFNKPNSSISQTLHSYIDEPLHYEGELAFLVESGELAAVAFGLDLTKILGKAKAFLNFWKAMTFQSLWMNVNVKWYRFHMKT